MNEPDIELQELENLLGDLDIPVQDEFTKQTFDLGQTTDMLLEEIEDFDIYETRQEFVNGDLLRFFDNPSIPNARQCSIILGNRYGMTNGSMNAVHNLRSWKTLIWH